MSPSDPRPTENQSTPRTASPAAATFAGFALPTSNTTYTPNQFFDVCLPYSSRGMVRLVAYMIRKTLGWCDEHGRPQTEQHVVSYADLEHAGISRGMIHRAITEALNGHFIRCVRPPQAKGTGRAAVSGLYELRWDERGEYVKDPTLFRGFFAGEGHRTYIPNQFFDELVPNESLAVLKVVGSVIRFSIGFQTKWGHRRRNVALSYRHIRNYALLADRTTLSQAIDHAIQHNYIERVEEGFFDPDGGKLSKAAVYALRWLNPAADQSIGMKTRPAETKLQNRFENPTGIGIKTRPADRYENPTDIEIKQGNKTLKQQPGDDAAAAVAFEKLKATGFDARAAQAIASRYPLERVERQIAWLDRRTITSNRLGMLRAAIREDWPAPAGSPAPAGKGKLGRPNLDPDRPSGASYTDALAAARERLSQANPHQPS
ncbi:MAG TPA: hypothetical protein VH475_20765 [Tepidisphaeraceae bacterium]|jgi:hypothetical protein